jgi:putative membrane protein
LTPVLAHTGRPLAPHDLWTAWNLDPLLLVGLLSVVWVYRRGVLGRADRDNLQTWCFAAAIAIFTLALVSPLDGLSGSLASAHMVQHMTLVVVAAPLLAVSAPGVVLIRGSPLWLKRTIGRWRRRLRLTPSVLRLTRDPIIVWTLHVATLWFWHAALPYEAALASPALHALEHASLLGTAMLFWRVAISARTHDRRSSGSGVLLVFAMALQSVFLAALLTFADSAWYPTYTETAGTWGLQPLVDQQLAGVIMWVPAGLVYASAGVALFVRWIRGTEQQPVGIIQGPP